jgi:asparagine synthase (glutamine-hydrolysing)
MCRIAGILNTSVGNAALLDMVENMCDLLKHGGPDDGGTFAVHDANLVLGNRRLSLLDLSAAGHQPMQYTNRYTITYNGELYNFSILKKELQALGKEFTTGTDTEVILAAFAQWGTNSFAKLNGMFAFALWDDTEKFLYLVRDVAGIKPLYYSTYQGGLAFASEIRAFSAIPYLHEANEKAAVYQLAYGFLPEPITTLKQVKPLPKGCFIAYDCTNSSMSMQLFSFSSFKQTIQNEQIAKQQIFDGLSTSVAGQMIADAPVGVFLSGGIDSAIIANLANNNAHNNLHTLSIYFAEQQYSEKKYQDLVAQKLQSKHHSILLTESNFHAHFPAILSAMDMPSCDGINTWFISKFAADEGLKAVLSGVGADELYGGYPSFSRINKALALQKMPNSFLRLAAKTNAKKYSRISYLQMKGMRGLYLFLRGHFAANEIAAQLGSYEKEIWSILSDLPNSPTLNIKTAKDKASWLEYNYYMQDQLLRDADVMSMAHGLEIRVPFLDNDVVSQANSIAENIKYDSKIGKKILIDSFENILPSEIWDRPKMGFSFPFAEWLRNSEFLKELSLSKNKNTQQACDNFLKGKLHWSRIMSLIVLNNR